MQRQRGRSAVILVVLLVLALVGVAIWFAMGENSSPEGGTPSVVPTGTVQPETGPKTAEPRKRARAERAWVALGVGEVTGIVLTYGTEKPVADHTVTLSAGTPGPDTTLTVKTGPDGSFRFRDVPNFDDWTLRVDVADPLADLEQGAVTVFENKVTDLGALYVTPAFTVPGIVIDEQGAPIEGAEVRALRPRPQGSQMDVLRLIRELPRDNPSVDKATTGADGKFRLTKTSPGSYDMKVVKAGRQVLVVKQVVVTPESGKRELRFTMSKGFQLDGRVVRKGPGPVAGLPVVAFRQPRGEFDFLVLDRVYATTADDGKFHLDGLGGGDYVVAATPEGEPFAIKDDLKVPGTSWVELVIEGDASLEGKITGKGGAPVGAAQVYVGILDRKPMVFGSTRTDAEGRYKIGGLRAGKVQLFLVQAEGYATWPGDLMSILQGRDAAVTLQPGPNVKDVALEGGGTIRGVVLARDDDTPIEGARVELGSPLALFGGTRGATTDGQGKFTILNVPVGVSVLVVSKDGWFQPGLDAMSLAMAFQSSGQKQKDTGRGYSVSITEPGETVERELKLARGSTLAGQVTTPDGTPLAGARVELRAESENDFLDGLAVLFGANDPRLTDAEGKFEMPGPKPGAKARVVATAPGFLQGRSEPVSATVGQRVENVAVRMRIGAYLEGKVTDDRGRPIEGALVRWLKTEGLQEWEIGWRIQSQQPSVTDSEGRYRTEGVEPGRVMVQIEETKHLPFTAKDVATDEGKSAVVDAKLTLGGVIEGRVVGTDGKPVSGAGVTLSFRAGQDEGMQWGDRDRVTADTEGKFRAEGLKPGQYELQATSRGWAPSEKTTVSADAAPVTLRLQAALRLGGVVRVRGAPVSGVQVSAMRAVVPDPGQNAARNENQDDRFEQAASAESGGDGKFLFEELPAGNYRLDFSPRGWGENRPNVVRKSVPDVAAGNEGLVVDLESGLLITGAVTVEDGSPASSGWVNATQVSTDGKPIERPANAWSQLEGGKFEIVGLAPGTYDVHVNVQGHGNKRVRAESGGPELKIVVGVGAKITGKIVREDGTAATNTWVQASMEGAAEGAVTDAEGRYTITGLEPGSYRLNAQSMGPAGGALGSIESVQVRAGDTVEAPAITLHPAQPAAPVPPGDK